MRPMSHVAAATVISGILAEDLCGVLLDPPTASAKRPAGPSHREVDPVPAAAAPPSAKSLSDLIHMLDSAI
jgi:hypothetical protein